MRRFLLIPLFLLFFAPAPASAGEVREIVLKDGTVMVGEIVSLSNGVFTVRTESLGTIAIDETKVQTIRQQGDPAASSDVNRTVQSLQERMVKDKEIMGLIESLRDDPGFQKALNDPAIMKAVNAGDVGALAANPEFMKLLQHSTVQNIKKKIGD